MMIFKKGGNHPHAKVLQTPYRSLQETHDFIDKGGKTGSRGKKSGINQMEEGRKLKKKKVKGKETRQKRRE